MKMTRRCSGGTWPVGGAGGFGSVETRCLSLRATLESIRACCASVDRVQNFRKRRRAQMTSAALIRMGGISISLSGRMASAPAPSSCRSVRPECRTLRATPNRLV